MRANGKPNGRKAPARRQPKQRRAQITVDAVLDAVVVILKQHGAGAVTTNRIADVAGVSVGSVYQYFPDKHAIFAALHDRHAEEIGGAVERTLAEHAGAPLEERMRALIGALVDAHSPDPELYELLDSEVPHRAHGARKLEERLRRLLRAALSERLPERPRDVEGALFVLAHMVDALAHGAALRRPPGLSLAAAKEEAVRAVVAYLRA
jgi:AcrR family transcriptional regulator